MADQSPDLGRAVTIDTSGKALSARLVLADDASDGAVWKTADGERLDLDDVSRWHP